MTGAAAGGAGRTIPPEVEKALAALREGLSRSATHDSPESRALLRDLLSRVVPSLGGGRLAYSFLANIDLASCPGLSPEEAENEVLAAMPLDTLGSLLPLFTEEAGGNPSGRDAANPPGRFDRLVGKVTFRLVQQGGREAGRLLETMFDGGLLGMDQLPTEVQERVVSTRLARHFLEDRKTYLDALDASPDQESYRLRTRPCARVVPALIEQGRFGEAAELAAMIAGHARDPGSGRAGPAEEALGIMVEAGTLEEAKKSFLSREKGEREEVARFFLALGERSNRYLTEIIREADSPERKDQAGRLMAESGGEGKAALLELADDPSVSGRTAALVIRIVGETEDPDLIPLASEIVLRRVDDPAPEARAAALRALCLLSPQGRFDAFHAALDDPEPRVRREAIRGLGLCGDQRSLPILRELVDRAEREGAKGDWEPAASAIDALGHAHGSTPGLRPEIEEFLAGFAGRACPAGMLKKALARRTAPPLALLALAHALSRTGGKNAVRVLERMARGADRPLAQKASDLLRKIGKRS